MTDENDHGQAGLSVPALEHIDRVCLKFEAAWKEGHKPRIEDYLGAVRGPERNGLLRELLLLDIDYRNGVDESATEAEYRERFAHDLQLVSDVFRQYYSEGFVDQPAMALDNTRDEPSLAARVGETIGPYKLMEQIGEGGMGIVYVAEQYAPVRRKVALKIIKPGMDTREMIARFEAERQALALMDHPNIAKVLDAGTTRAGRPYFVMELVKGIPVTQYCDDHRLTPKERLELLIPICQAVQHAHQKGVIHRDIKPSNVLMALYDVQPVPKVIDFGVAKATNQKLTENTMFTQFGQIVGTLEYMSPEQANLNQLDVDTRSDIYSLGVLLYELLTGCTPFTKERLRSAAFEEMLRIIREEEPARPSARLSTINSLASVATSRHVEPRKLISLVRGELDWIVMKAMEKDRARRYETASGLAKDLERYLNNEAVVACPPSAVYRLRKYVRRNRLPIAAILAFLAVIAVATSLGNVAHRLHLRKEESQRLAEIAEKRRLKAELDARVEEGLRLSSDYHPDFGGAVDCFTRVLESRPEDASLYLFRGSAYYQWGYPERAIQDLEHALELSNQDNLAAHYLIALAAQDLGDKEKAEIHRRLAQEQAPESVEALVTQALALQYNERSLELMNRAVQKQPFDPLLYFRRGQVCVVLAREFDKSEYYQIAERDLEMALVSRPQDNRLRLSLCQLWLFGAKAAEDPTASKEKARVFLEAWLKREPDNNAAIILLMAYYNHNGQAAKSLALLSDDQLRGKLPRLVLGELGHAYCRVGEYEKSLEMYDRAVEAGGVDWVLTGRAISHAKLGRHDLARRDIEKALSHGPRYQHRRAFFLSVCPAYYALNDYQAIIRVADSRLTEVPGDAQAHVWRARAYAGLVDLEAAIADCCEAIRLDPSASAAFLIRGECQRQLGKLEAAIADYGEAIQLDPSSSVAFHFRGECQRLLGNLEAAIADYGMAIQLDPSPSAAFYFRGECQRLSGNLEAAIADYGMAIQLDPSSSAAFYFRGECQRQSGNLEAAIVDYGKIIQLDPSHYWSFLARGECQRLLGNLEAASADYQQAIKTKPTTGAVWAQLIGFELARSTSAETIEMLVSEAEAAVDGPAALEFLFQYAAWNLLCNHQAEYERLCHDLITRFADSTSPRTLSLTARSAALTHQPVVDADRLVEMARQAVAGNPTPWHQHNLGLCLLRNAQYDAAIERFNQSLEPTWDGVPASWLGLAIAHARRGHVSRGQEWLEKAHEWFNQNPLDVTSRLHPHDRIECRLLLREAEELIQRVGPAEDDD